MSKLFEVLAVLQGLAAVTIAAAVSFNIVFDSRELQTQDWTFLLLSLLVGAVFSRGVSGTSRDMEEQRGKDR